MTTLTQQFRKRRPMPVLHREQRHMLDDLIKQRKLKREHHNLLAVFRKYADQRYPKKSARWREECAHSWLHQYLDDETAWEQFADGAHT